MVSLEELERLVSEISKHKIEKLVECVQVNNPELISLTVLKDLQFTQSESSKIKNAINQAKSGTLLAIILKLILKIQALEKSRDVRLVISGNFWNAKADYTHETIYQMINRAKKRIVIIGYFMYEIQGLMRELSKLQDEKGLQIKFIMDSAKKWKKQILQEWNKKTKPDIFESDSEHIKKLHAKIIIIDNTEILITSANLTINAMKDNIEAGIWTTRHDIISSCYDVIKEFEKNGTIKRFKNYE